MRNLSLLVRKDFTSAMVNSGYFLFFMLIWVAMVALNPTMTPLMYVMLVYVFVISLFANEENDLVCNVCGILPIRKSEPVIARYLYAYSILAAQAVLNTLLGLGLELVFGRRSDWLPMMLLSLAACLLMISVVMPLLYKFGMMKMRILSFVLYLVIVMASSALAPMAREFLPSASLTATAIGVAVVTLVLSALSMAISLRIKR